MADHTDILVDGLTRVRDNVHAVLDGLTPEQLAWQPAPGANSIGWIVWHLTRVQDDHVAHVAGADQVWRAGGWVARFALPYDEHDIGYGQGPEQVAVFTADAQLLIDYHDAVYNASCDYVRTLTADDLDRVVDTRWDPPVTLAVRLVSVVDDDAQHVGQADYVRGILPRKGSAGS